MVSTASTAAQANEIEKKRKQTLEKAKANHLSRQLQMRLQYARLKVEHGWHYKQRQNLNEVENLYFHHSHQRGPRSFPPSSAFIPTQTDSSSILALPSKFSDPVYKGWLESISRSYNMDSQDENPSQENSTTGNLLSVPPTSPVPSSQISLGTRCSTSAPPVSAELRAFQPSPNPTSFAETPVTVSQIPASEQDGQSEHVASTHADVPPMPTPDLPITAMAQQGLPSRAFAYPSGNVGYMSTTLTANPMPLSMPKKSPSAVKTTASLTTKDMLGFNSASLTYDSFWSGLQSKSYSTLKNASVTISGGEALTGNGSPFNGQASKPPSTPDNTTTALPVISVQNSVSTPTLSPPSLPPAPPHPQPQGTSPTVTPASLAATVPTSITPSLSMPITMPLTMPVPITAQPTSPPQAQMQIPNRYLTENFAPWSFSSVQPPGVPTVPHSLIPTSLLANPAFLASLSASYTQAFGAAGSHVHPPTAGIPDGIDPQTTPAAAQPNVPVSPTAPPVVSAFVGQQGS